MGVGYRAPYSDTHVSSLLTSTSRRACNSQWSKPSRLARMVRVVVGAGGRDSPSVQWESSSSPPARSRTHSALRWPRECRRRGAYRAGPLVVRDRGLGAHPSATHLPVDRAVPNRTPPRPARDCRRGRRGSGGEKIGVVHAGKRRDDRRVVQRSAPSSDGRVHSGRPVGEIPRNSSETPDVARDGTHDKSTAAS